MSLRGAQSAYWRSWVSPRGKNAFIDTCPAFARVLDVGCGRNSPAKFKAAKPGAYYVGIDVADCGHANDPRDIADEYILASPDGFAAAIAEIPHRFDAVISAHNLEHCHHPRATLHAMCGKLVPAGRLYLAFPSEATVGFPSRAGCLNFRDDPTHQANPPRYSEVVETLENEGLLITFSARRYRPVLKALAGLVLEPLSAVRRKVLPGTWALYGFETVIWAERPHDAK